MLRPEEEAVRDPMVTPRGQWGALRERRLVRLAGKNVLKISG